MDTEVVSNGRAIRQVRRARGWSQGRLAAQINAQFGTNLEREYVSRWERGAVAPGPYYLRCLSAVLDVPFAVWEDEVKRRTFLSDLCGTTVAPLVASEMLRTGFATRLHGGPTPEEWDATLEVYGTDYMSLGAEEIQRRLARDLVVIQQQLDEPRLWAAAARLITLYAKTFPGHDGSKAVTWYRMAAEAADRSGDTDVRVWVRGRAAIALGYEGASLPVANRFADQAIGIAGDRWSLGLLNAIMGKAHAAALHGDHASARRLAEHGARVFEVAGSDEQTSDYAVPWWRQNVFLSLLHARLGDEHAALEAQARAKAELPATLPRFATHLRMHTGLMLVRAGDRSGIDYARTALDALPPEKHSLTLRMLMAEITA